ncbi:MAG: GNAT family N-acetyltransferase [Clostridiales bacterium]|nr:GNAT family N-acetyltransferase [Clostridiales bacterium]
MEIIIRNITEADIPVVVDIQVDGWRTAYKGIIDESFLNSMNKEERIEQRKSDYKKGNFIVAESDNEVIGFCRYHRVAISPDGENFDCELMALYVKPELKQQGIGKAMFNYVVNDLTSKGKNKMILWCLKDNYPSRKFYEKMGGKVVGEHEIEIGGKAYQEVGFGFYLK